MDTITFKEIDDKTPVIFEDEKRKILENLGNVSVEHVGATSIPGSITQGDLDINVRMPAVDFEISKECLSKLYRAHRPDTWEAGFANFKDDAKNIDIMLTVIGSSLDHFVELTEYLKSHPGVVSELNELKRRYQGKSRAEYGMEKGKFFHRLCSSISKTD